MTAKDDVTYGKARLDVASYAADLSGKDFESVYLDSTQTLSHSFLNGTSFKRSAFLGAPIDQTELAEAQIQDCFFNETDFTGSSFIGATVENTTFENCIFADGEWRKSRFSNVTFKNCNFHYTTINLCIFLNCNFLGEITKHLDNRSVNYNVFAQSHFDFFSEDEVVLANNYGLPSEGEGTKLANSGSSISLEEICNKSSSGKIIVSEFVNAIENEFTRMRAHRLKMMRLEFISNIIHALATTKNISATSLAYLEELFSSLAKASTREADALAAMSVVLSIRSLLFDLADRSSFDSEYAGYLCQSVEIRYERIYSQFDSFELAKILGEIANGNPDTFTVSRFSSGSTLIDLIAIEAVSVGATMMAINFTLRQINTTLVQAQKIRTNIAKLFSTEKNTGKRRKKKMSRVPALQRSGAASKETSLLRQAVATHGYHAVLLDDEAETTIYYVSSK